MFGFSRMAHRHIRYGRRSHNCEIPRGTSTETSWSQRTLSSFRWAPHSPDLSAEFYTSFLWAIWSPKSIKKVPNTFRSYRMPSQTSLVSFSRRVCAVALCSRASVSFKARAEQCIRRWGGHFELLVWSGTVSVAEKVHDWCNTWIITSILALSYAGIHLHIPRKTFLQYSFIFGHTIMKRPVRICSAVWCT